MIESGQLPGDNSPVGAYLKANPQARQEVLDMMDLSRLIRDNFQVSAEERDHLEPSPGFYARVMARIESQALPPSIWNFFLEPLGMRLVYASLTLAALLFAATLIDTTPDSLPLVASEPPATFVEDAPLQGAMLASDGPSLPVVESTPEHDRGSALVHLTTYEQ